MLGEARFPIFDRTRWDRETRTDYLPGSARSATGTGPGKKRNRSARPAAPIAEVQVIGRWIIEIDSALGQAKSDALGVKIDLAMRNARDGRDKKNSTKLNNR